MSARLLLVGGGGLSSKASRKSIEQYEHRGSESVNSLPVGLVSHELNGVGTKRRYEYDPRLDPQLARAGKASHLRSY